MRIDDTNVNPIRKSLKFIREVLTIRMTLYHGQPESKFPLCKTDSLKISKNL